MSINWQNADSPAPRLLALPAGVASLDEAHAAIELWEFYKRRRLDPSQRLAVEVMMATSADGLWAASTTGQEKPRQCGKGDEIEVVELWGLTQRSERILHTIHDAVLLATETHSRMLSLIEGHADLRRLKARDWKGTGQQMIEMRNGGIIWYRTRTGGGGRGIDEVDRVVVDEAQHAEVEQLAAVTPTQSVSANPQLNALGTGGLDGKSAWWWSQRKLAKMPPADFGWVGYSAQPWEIDDRGSVVLGEVDATDRSVWRAVHTALVAGRVAESFLERELRTLGPERFGQEYLCVWAPPPLDVEVVGLLDVDVWESLFEAGSQIEGAVSVALDVSPDRRFAAFGVAGLRADSRTQVEVADHRPGTGWVLDRGVELSKRWGPIRIEASAPAASFIEPFKAKGASVVEVGSADHARALGRLLDEATSDRLRHLGDRRLAAAIRHAEVRTGGEADRLARRSSKADITTLVAVTLALGGLADRQLVPLGAWR